MIGFYNKDYVYRLFLCNIDNSQICEIDYSSIQFTQNFRTFNELSFEVQRYNNGWQLNKDERYDLTDSLYKILMQIVKDDEIQLEEYFIIDNPESTLEENGIKKKQVHCYASHYYIFNKRILRSYTKVLPLYDSDEYASTKGIINYMLVELFNSWTVAYINDKYKNLTWAWNYSSSTYTEVFEDIEKQLNCVFIFDNVNCTISIYAPEEIGNDSDIVLSGDNFIKSLKYVDKSNEVITRIRMEGKNNITCAKYNPTGQLYVDNFDYFANNGKFSTSLITAYNLYKKKLQNKIGVFNGYVDQLNTYDVQLNTKNNELATLKTELNALQEQMLAERVASYSNTSTYNSLYSQAVAKQTQISNKQAEIDSINHQIYLVNNNIIILQSQLKYRSNFNSGQLKELNNFIYETDLTLNAVEDKLALYNYAVNYVAVKSKPILDISVDMIDIFSTPENQLLWDKVKIGDFVYVDAPDVNKALDYLKIRIVKITHDKLNNKLSIELSNSDKINTELLYLKDLLKVPNQAANTIITNQDSYSQYTNDAPNIIYQDSTITNTIQAGNVTINQQGFIGNDIGSNGAIQLQNDKIIITNDNWATYHTLLSGNGIYLEKADKTSRIVINPEYGFQIDKNTGTTSIPIWSNQLYLDNEGNINFEGNMTGGSINIDTDIYVGNKIYIGNPNTIEVPKSIIFYGAGANACVIEMETDNSLILLNGDSINIRSVNGNIELQGYYLDMIASGSATISASDYCWIRSDRLSFFTSSPTGQQSIQRLSTSATIEETNTKINEILNAIGKYGLLDVYD